MISELRKSFGAVLYERASSPLYGAFLISWLLWNWKVPYVTFFVKASEIDATKIEWLITNCSDISALLVYPLVSTIFLLTVVPFIANGFYWLHVKFNKWKVDQRNQIEMKSLLTLEQSMSLREEIVNTEKNLESVLEGKDIEISQLKAQINELTSVRKETVPANEVSVPIDSISMAGPGIDDVSRIADKIDSSEELRSTFIESVEYIQGGYSGLIESEKVSSNALAYLEVNHLIVSKGNGKFELSDLGRDVLKEVLNEAFN